LNTNALGPLRIVESLLTKLQDASKLAFITSRMGSIADNTSGGRYGYRMSKVALNMAAVSLSYDLAARHIPVGIYHPGLVGTEMIGGVGNVTPDEAAASIVERINELDMTKTGQFFHANGERLLW
jgi:NAD(P)-dependent dehydrogenase (short-subunit alcohol dehydrogenase family)